MKLTATILTAALLALAVQGVQAHTADNAPRKGAADEKVDFDRYFEDKTMRFDFYHCGDAASEDAEVASASDQVADAGKDAVSGI